MIVSLVAAMAENRVIGKDNHLPWHIPAELALFHRITMGKPVIMGRRTHQSIGKALPGRTNIVISRNPAYMAAEGCGVVSSLDQALGLAGDAPETCIIGGEAIYRLALPRADRIYLTTIALQPEGDAWFPEFEADFRVEEVKSFDGSPAYVFRIYARHLQN